MRHRTLGPLRRYLDGDWHLACGDGIHHLWGPDIGMPVVCGRDMATLFEDLPLIKGQSCISAAQRIMLHASRRRAPDTVAVRLLSPGCVLVPDLGDDVRPDVYCDLTSWLRTAPKDDDGYTHVWVELLEDVQS